MNTVTEITEFHWIVLDPGVAALRNRLLSAGGRLAFEAGSSRWKIHVLPETPRGYRAAYAAEAEVRGRALRLDLDRLPLPGLLGYPLEGVPDLEVPEDLLPALLEGALAGLLAAAETVLGSPVRIMRVRAVPRDAEFEEDPEGHRLDLGLKEEEGPGRIRARPFLDAEEMEALAEAATAAPATGNDADKENAWDRVPVRLVIRAGEVRMAAEELAGLEAGDVVLLDRDPASAGALRLLAGEGDDTRYQWAGTRKGDAAVIEKEIAVENLDKGAVEGAATHLESVEVPLAFDLGTRPAALAELRALAAGTVVELPANPEGRVTLRAGGRAIGTGTFVMIGDRAGVRIDAIWKGD
jgi:type III secretion system YscQ/HrcQ family protein